MQDLKPIRVFLKVTELRSFAAAARSLRTTPATVTRIIANLEEDLGQQLLLRTTRQVALTSAGAMVAARYGPLVQEFDQVTQDVTRALRPDRGRLSINAPMSLGMRLMPKLVDSFQLAYPNIAIDLKLTDTLVDIVEEPCDLAIRISGPPSDKSTIWRKLCEVPRHVFAAPHLFNRIPRPQTPNDLPPDLCLSYSAVGQGEVWTFEKDGTRRQIQAGSKVVCNNGDFLCSLVKAGKGFALLPDFIAQGGPTDGATEIVLADWQIPSLWLMLYYPPYDVLPPLIAIFTDFFAAYLHDVDGLDFTDKP